MTRSNRLTVRRGGRILSRARIIDIQVNGFAGVDYNSRDTARRDRPFDPRAVRHGRDALLSHRDHRGSGRYGGALRNLLRAKDTLPEGEAMEGFHMEGPHISPEDGPRGAHPSSWVRPPDLDEFRRWQDAPTVTCAS